MKRCGPREDGTVFEEAFGADLYVAGELVFATAMTGFTQSDHGSRRSDPLFTFQLLAQQGSIRDDSESTACCSGRSAFGGDNWRSR